MADKGHRLISSTSRWEARERHGPRPLLKSRASPKQVSCGGYTAIEHKSMSPHCDLLRQFIVVYVHSSGSYRSKSVLIS